MPAAPKSSSRYATSSRPSALDGAASYCADVAAVVVAYRPDLARLAENLRSVRDQCEVVLVDNGDTEAGRERVRAVADACGVAYVRMGRNAGIGAAQNAGCEWVRSRGKQFVLLLDDDSRLQEGAVAALTAADVELRAAGHRVAAVGARARARDGTDVSNAPPGRSALTPERDMMSSGALIRTDVLGAVGGMEERLFIDCVDFEWGWRAQAMGMRIFLVSGATIEHQLGVGTMQLCGARLGVPSPVRHYYQCRNVIEMLRRPYVPWRWKLRQCVALVVKPTIFGLLVAPRTVRLLHIARGVRDGLLRRGGAYGG